MMTLTRPLVFLDLETTGTDPYKDRIVELAAVKLFPDGNTEAKVRRLNPGVPIPPQATECHGIKDEDVKNCPTFQQLSEGVWFFIQDCDIAGFNSNSFDVPMLVKEFQRAGIEWDYTGVNFIDVGNIYKRLHERSLKAAFEEYTGLSLEGAHSAETDAHATAKVLQLMHGLHDLPQTAEALALYSNFDRKQVDLAGVFEIDNDGDYRFTRGKHKGMKAKAFPSYLKWMLEPEQDFLPDARRIARELQAQHYRLKNFKK